MHDAERIRRERGLRDAVLAGDESAWGIWYAETYAALEAYVRWRCGNGRDLVDDALQETWMIAVRSLGRFQPEAGSFHGWICGIAVNVIRNALRGRKRREHRRRSLDPEIAAPPSPAAEERERSRAIALALDSLPPRYERVLRAKYLDRHSVAAIAVMWGETEKSIESLLSRARAAFRDAFKPQE